MLSPGTTLYWYRHREMDFVKFFTEEGSLVFYTDVKGLMSMMGHDNYDASM